MFTFEGYYFPPPMRRFIARDWQGRKVVRIAHPSRGVLELPVCLSKSTCDFPGFIGIEINSTFSELPAPSGYFLSSLTGRARYNSAGQLTGEALYAAFPHDLADTPLHSRPLDYRPDEPPYQL